MWTQQLRQALGRGYQQGADEEEEEEAEAEAEAEEARARALYAGGSSSIDDKWWQTIDLITDTEFGCPTLRLAESLSTHATGDDEESGGGGGGVQVRTPIKLSTDLPIKLSTERASITQVYQFNQRSRYSHAPPRWGVYHASELQYLLRSTLPVV
jgi:carboxylesterase type B